LYDPLAQLDDDPAGEIENGSGRTGSAADPPLSTQAISRCGEVTLRFQWLQIMPEIDCEDGAIVRVKFDELYLPFGLGEERAAVCVRIGQNQQMTKAVHHRPLPKNPQRTHQELVFEIEQVVNLMLPPGSKPEGKVLELSVVNPKGKTLGTYSLNLSDVDEAPCKTKAWPRQARMRFMFAQGPSQKGLLASAGISAEVVVSWLGLELVTNQEAMGDLFLHRMESPVSVTSLALSRRWGHGCYDARLRQPPADSLDWVNKMFEKMWPKVMNLIRATIENPDGRVNQKLQAKMPYRILKRIRFILGWRSPKFELIKIGDAPARLGQEGMQGVELHLRFKLGTRSSKAAKRSDIELSTGIFDTKLGFKSFEISGDLVVRLEPLLEEMPVVGGVVVCCLNRPRVDVQFSGLAAQFVERGMEGSLRGLIDWGISSCLVMPNVMGFPIGEEEQGVHGALLRHPHLAGVLRVTVLRAKVWHRDGGVLGGLLRRLCCSSRMFGCSSRVQLRVTVGDEPHFFEDVLVAHTRHARGSSAITPAGSLQGDEEDTEEDDEESQSAGEDVEEEASTWDFLVYDERQHLEIELVDRCGLESVVAQASPMVCDKSIVEFASKPIELRSIQTNNRRQREGKVSLRCQRLDAKHGSRGHDEWSMVRVRVDELFVPADLLLPEEGFEETHMVLGLGAWLIAKIDTAERVTPMAKYYVSSGEESSGAQPPLTKSVSELLSAPSVQLELEMEWLMYVPVKRSCLEKEVLNLELHSKTQGHIGSASVPLAEALKRPDLKLAYGGHTKMLQISGPRDLNSEVNVAFSIMGLEPARV